MVKKGDKFAHGKTIKEAKKSLIYKISDRDTTRFKYWTLDTKINFEDAVTSYIVITGACARGTEMFVDSLREIPKIITPRVIIELTEGQYNHNVYKEFFKCL